MFYINILGLLSKLKIRSFKQGNNLVQDISITLSSDLEDDCWASGAYVKGTPQILAKENVVRGLIMMCVFIWL